MAWFRKGVLCDPPPFDFKEQTLFRPQVETFSHELVVYVEEDGETVPYVFWTLIPNRYLPGILYCLALVDGEHGVWRCSVPTRNGQPVPGTVVEVMYPAEKGLYQ